MRMVFDGGLPLGGELIEIAVFDDVTIDYELLHEALAVVAESNRLADLAENSYLFIVQHLTSRPSRARPSCDAASPASHSAQRSPPRTGSCSSSPSRHRSRPSASSCNRFAPPSPHRLFRQYRLSYRACRLAGKIRFRWRPA